MLAGRTALLLFEICLVHRVDGCGLFFVLPPSHTQHYKILPGLRDLAMLTTKYMSIVVPYPKSESYLFFMLLLAYNRPIDLLVSRVDISVLQVGYFGSTEARVCFNCRAFIII